MSTYVYAPMPVCLCVSVCTLVAFGELALLYNSPRSATVIASVDSVVWVITRRTFRSIIIISSEEKLKGYEKCLAVGVCVCVCIGWCGCVLEL